MGRSGGAAHQLAISLDEPVCAHGEEAGHVGHVEEGAEEGDTPRPGGEPMGWPALQVEHGQEEQEEQEEEGGKGEVVPDHAGGGVGSDKEESPHVTPTQIATQGHSRGNVPEGNQKWMILV